MTAAIYDELEPGCLYIRTNKKQSRDFFPTGSIIQVVEKIPVLNIYGIIYDGKYKLITHKDTAHGRWKAMQ